MVVTLESKHLMHFRLRGCGVASREIGKGGKKFGGAQNV